MTIPNGTQLTLPAPAGADLDDPDSVLRVFLARYFRPGLIDSYIRTFVPAGMGYALSWLALNFQWLHLPNHPSPTFSATVTVAGIAGYYFLARLVEKKWPKLGVWLVALNLTKTRPVYVAPGAAAPVEEAAGRTPDQVIGRHAAPAPEQY